MKSKLLIVLIIFSTNRLFSQNQWQQIWADEFDYTGLPNSDKWSYDIGCATNNNEKQYYAKEKLENTRVENGNLIIEAKKEISNGCNYTSGRIKSMYKGDWLYGKFEIRAKIPAFKGTWPAIWFLPSDNEYGIWPKSGEIDLMENVGFEPNKTYFTVHTESYNHILGTQVGTNTSTTNLSKDFHTYTLEWYADSIFMYLDGNKYFSFKKTSTNYKTWPFDKRFHILLNLAIGGDWGGLQGIDDTQFPTQFVIDYVRVYQLQKNAGPYVLNILNNNNGTVTNSPQQDSYALNQQVSILAIPNIGYEFKGWQSDFYSSSNPMLLNMNRDLTLSSKFKKVGEMVLNGDFQDKTTNWKFINGGTSVGTSTIVNEELNISVSTANSSSPWDIQLQQISFNLINGHTYQLSFDAKSSNTMAVTAGLGLNAAPWKSYGGITTNIVSEFKTYTKTFTMTTSDPIARLYFDLGKNTGTLTMDNISLIDITLLKIEDKTMEDINTSFYYLKDKKTLNYRSDDPITAIFIYSFNGQILKELKSVSNHEFDFETTENAVIIKYLKNNGQAYSKKIILN